MSKANPDAGGMLLVIVGGLLLYNYLKQSASASSAIAQSSVWGSALPPSAPAPIASPPPAPAAAPAPQVLPPQITPLDAWWKHFAQNFQEQLREQQWMELQSVFSQGMHLLPGSCPPGYYYDDVVAGGCVHPVTHQ